MKKKNGGKFCAASVYNMNDNFFCFWWGNWEVGETNDGTVVFVSASFKKKRTRLFLNFRPIN